MELLGSNIKKFQITETLLILFSVREIELFSPLRENLLYFRKRKPRKNVLYILKGKRSLDSQKRIKTLVSGNRTFLCFRKGIFRTLA